MNDNRLFRTIGCYIENHIIHANWNCKKSIVANNFFCTWIKAFFYVHEWTAIFQETHFLDFYLSSQWLVQHCCLHIWSHCCSLNEGSLRLAMILSDTYWSKMLVARGLINPFLVWYISFLGVSIQEAWNIRFFNQICIIPQSKPIASLTFIRLNQFSQLHSLAIISVIQTQPTSLSVK